MQGTVKKIDSIQSQNQQRQLGFSSLRKFFIVNIKDATLDTNFS